MKKIYLAPSMEVEDVKMDCMICLSGTADGEVIITDGGNAGTSVTEGDAKVWGGNIFDEDN